MRFTRQCKMKLFTITVVLLLFIHGSYCGVWQNKDHPAANLNKYYKDLAKIPPWKETAAKFARYFLDRHITVGRYSRMRMPRDVTNTRKKNKQKYDITFIIDSSDSVKRINFNRGLIALQRIVKRGLSETNYAAISFSNHAKLDFLFIEKESAMEKLKDIKYHPGKTNTQEALHMALKQLINRSNTSNVREGSVRRVLLMTDGLSNVKSHLTLQRGWELKNSGVEIFVIAVGLYDYGFEEIVGLASSTTAHLYRVENMEGFLRVVKLIPTRPLEKSWLSSMIQSRLQGKK